MGWDELSEKVKRFMPRDSISCENRTERLLIRQLVKEEFPELGDDVIDAAIQACCKNADAPWDKERYLLHLRQLLPGKQ